MSACNAGDPGSIPGSGRSPGEGNGSPLQKLGNADPLTSVFFEIKLLAILSLLHHLIKL